MYINISERVLKSQSSLWLSDTGTWLAFLKLNDSRIGTLSFPDIENDKANEREEGMRYAKVLQIKLK